VVIDTLSFAAGTFGSAYDFGEHFGAGLAVGYIDKAYLVDAQNSRPTCDSVMIEVYDSNQAGTKESYSLSGLAFEVGTIGGARRASTARKMS
jgi:hypothetical protein